MKLKISTSLSLDLGQSEDDVPRFCIQIPGTDRISFLHGTHEQLFNFATYILDEANKAAAEKQK